jgi:signal transduction histidine kinase
VSVRVTQAADGLVLDVEDDGPGPGRSARQGSGTALRDLRRRLELVYGGAASLVTGPRTSVTGGASGHAVKLRVPFDTRLLP